MGALAPRVVLVAPENPRNVGFVARAMKCFDSEELFVVGKPWTKMPAEAKSTGVSAIDILESARFVPDLSDALRGCSTAVAFTRRPTTLRQKGFDLGDAPPLSGRVALVFGRESNGLTKEEFALCPWRARIPCREGLSLNLGQAAAVALYGLTAKAAPAAAKSAAPPRASLDRMLALWDFLEPKLAAAPRFDAERLRRVRQMLYRLDLSDDDFDLLFAAMRGAARPN